MLRIRKVKKKKKISQINNKKINNEMKYSSRCHRK